VNHVAQEIERYLGLRPDAADTLAGIQRWWLGERGIEESREVLQLALQSLCERGLVTESEIGGLTLYRAAPGSKGG